MCYIMNESGPAHCWVWTVQIHLNLFRVTDFHLRIIVKFRSDFFVSLKIFFHHFSFLWCWFFFFLQNKFSVCLDMPHVLDLSQVYYWTPPSKMAVGLQFKSKFDWWILQCIWGKSEKKCIRPSCQQISFSGSWKMWTIHEKLGKKMKNINRYKSSKYVFQNPMRSIFHLHCE